MKQKLIDSINFRMVSELSKQNPVRFLKELRDTNKISTELMVEIAISVIFLYTRVKGSNKKPGYMAEIVSTIGHTIRNKAKLKRNSAVAAKAGSFILYSFEQYKIIEVILGQGPTGHGTYIVNLLDDEVLSTLFHKLPSKATDKLPSDTPYKAWETAFHPSGISLVKTGNYEVLNKLLPEKYPIVFEVVNRKMNVGWNINKDVYELSLWAFRNKTAAFNDIWTQLSSEARATKQREAKTIAEIAKRFLNKDFYHLYYFDFRGRIYPSTAYLHEQGSDYAKGLLLRKDYKEIGKSGFFWLCVSISNNWAGDCGRDDGLKSDKIPLQDRYQWVLDNEEIFVDYANNPKVNQGWMSAEKPWQFIAACIEFRNIRKWQEGKAEALKYDYNSHLEVYIDGSNNGAQHLSALTRDEITAPHVNLVPSDLPGDLYAYVAKYVWKRIDEEVSKLSKNEIKKYNSIIDTIIDLKLQIKEAPQNSDRRKELIEEILSLKKENEGEIEKCASVFWKRVTSLKERRKIAKRNIMTLPYGATPYGMGNQVIDDSKKHGIHLLLSMEHKWGAYLGREIFETCKEALKRPMRLLSTFETAGRLAENEGRFLEWVVPITNFPVVQNYVEGTPKKVYVQYGPQTGQRNSTGYYDNTYQLSICFLEDTKPSKRKQSQGASPNAIHSLDAAHLMLTCHNCKFDITTIHDSYGSLLGDMQELYKIVRESFVELYEEKPLDTIIGMIKGDISNVEIGTLDISLILESEYAFS